MQSKQDGSPTTPGYYWLWIGKGAHGQRVLGHIQASLNLRQLSRKTVTYLVLESSMPSVPGLPKPLSRLDGLITHHIKIEEPSDS